MTDIVHAAPQWYPGSTKEIRVCYHYPLPLVCNVDDSTSLQDTVEGYKEVEKKIEAMIELVQVHIIVCLNTMSTSLLIFHELRIFIFTELTRLLLEVPK